MAFFKVSDGASSANFNLSFRVGVRTTAIGHRGDYNKEQHSDNTVTVNIQCRDGVTSISSPSRGVICNWGEETGNGQNGVNSYTEFIGLSNVNYTPLD